MRHCYTSNRIAKNQNKRKNNNTNCLQRFRATETQIADGHEKGCSYCGTELGAVSHNVKHMLTVRATNCTTSFSPREIKPDVHTKPICKCLH